MPWMLTGDCAVLRRMVWTLVEVDITDQSVTSATTWTRYLAESIAKLNVMVLRSATPL